MKLRIYSDVHNEFIRGKEWHPLPLDTDAETVLVLAGDIDNAKHVVKYVDSMADRFLGIVYVLGNHELWTHNIDRAYEKFNSELPNVHLLQNNSVTIGDVEFLGTTLWTDINNENPFDVWNAPHVMVPDFRKIRQTIDYKRLSPARWLYENRKAKRFLKNNIVAGKKQVVVTHHAPDYVCSVGNECRGNGSDCYYYNNNMQELICDAGFWVFGHTHHAYDKYLGNTRVVSNPRGYVDYLVDDFIEGNIYEV